MLGPLRSCMYPRIFRSTSVRKAMANKIGIININRLIKNILLRREFESLNIKF